MSEIERQIKERNRDMRREFFVRRILDGLRDTVRVYSKTPETPVGDVDVAFTDKSAAYLAQVLEAVFILEDIVAESGGCVGHKDCAHSMEAFERARTLIHSKWQADHPDGRAWPI